MLIGQHEPREWTAASELGRSFSPLDDLAQASQEGSDVRAVDGPDDRT
jgi:hypothetical protein